MTDEKFVFVTDVKDKKRVARGANAKVRGTGRRVNFPSDYLTEREKKSMNSEVKSFDLKQPMKWAEFCSMPDDLRREYILRLQKLYGAGDVAMAEMMGVSQTAVFKQRKSLGIESVGRGKKPLPEWDSFVKYGTPREATPLGDLIPPEVKAKLDEYEEKHPPAVIQKPDKPREETSKPFALPISGDIRLKGTAVMIGETLYLLTGGENISCRISWETIREG